MGGCKCSFKGCKNNTILAKETNSIHSHFFHFPVKDEHRCIEWAIFSDNMEFLNLPVEKLKNKVICDKHFPETSFMNYTRSKLTKTTSIPTIYFDPDDVEMDLLETPTDWVIENRRNKPISGFLPSPGNSRNTKSRIDIDESSDSVTLLNVSSPTIIKKEIVKRPEVVQQTIQKEVRILNRLPKPTISLNNQLHSLGEIKQIIKKSPPNQSQGVKRAFATTDKRVMSSSPAKILKQEILPPVPTIEEQQIEFMYVDPPAAIAATKPEVPDCSQEIKSILKDVAEIKTMINEKLQQQPQQVPMPSTSISESSNINQSHFNKVQLFNGIKRYLSPSLIALLRMEIFATPNREFKKDEKIICGEILKLGTEVYDFFNDEWRLRLPSKDMVKNWQNEDITDDDAS